MTPDAVLKRYLELASGLETDAAALYPLLAVDADLLSRWVATLGCTVERAAIERGLDDLGPTALAAFARAQIWAVVPLGGAVRFGVDQWRNALLSACIAQTMLDRTGYRDSESARLRILLASSGIQQSNDRLLAELVEFRGVEPALLVDAHPVLRAFAVSEAFEHHGRAQAARLAADLFHFDDAIFADIVAAAEKRVSALIAQAGLQFEGAEDWLQQLWVQAQLAAFATVLARENDAGGLQDLSRRVSRALFGHEPRMFLLDATRNVLEGVGNDDLAALKLPVATSPSVAAVAVRERRAANADDDARSAVTDRQLMRRLGAERVEALPLFDDGAVVGAIVFRVGEDDAPESALLMAGYAAELGRQLGALRRGDEALGEALVAYRARHEKRLREIVHEANNPLSIINNYLHILELKLKDHPDTNDPLRLVGAEIRRAASIFRKVTEFPEARESLQTKTVPDTAPVDLNAVARAVVDLVRGSAAELGIGVEARLQEEGASVTSLRDHIMQVLTNLVRNAIEAMREGGTLTLETASPVYRAGRAGAELIVRDTGPGLPDEVVSTLYAPKRSRKGGEHAGLGLHITARLVDELEGAIDVRTSRGRGTTFSVFVPELAPQRA